MPMGSRIARSPCLAAIAAKAKEHAHAHLHGYAARSVERRITGLVEAIESVAKSVKWKMRARVGERVQWYELPEEI